MQSAEPRIVQRQPKPFAGLDEKLRSGIAMRLMQARSPELYGHREGRLLSESKAEILRLHANPRIRRIRFGDWGAGQGAGLLRAVDTSPKVDAFGLSPSTRPPAVDSKRWIRGHFEQVIVPNYFHVIQTTYGLMHANNHAIALENTLNSLKPEGVLISTLGEFYGRASHLIFQKKLEYEYLSASAEKRGKLEKTHPGFVVFRMLLSLEKGGFQVNFEESDKPADMIGVKIRRGRRKANLREFYADPNLNRFPIQPATMRSTRK